MLGDVRELVGQHVVQLPHFSRFVGIFGTFGVVWRWDVRWTGLLVGFLVELDRLLGFDRRRTSGWRLRLSLRGLHFGFLLLDGRSFDGRCRLDFRRRWRCSSLGLGLFLLSLGLWGRFRRREERRQRWGGDRFPRRRSRLGSFLFRRLRRSLDFRLGGTAFARHLAPGLAVQGSHRELGGRVRRGARFRQIRFAALAGSGQRRTTGGTRRREAAAFAERGTRQHGSTAVIACGARIGSLFRELLSGGCSAQGLPIGVVGSAFRHLEAVGAPVDVGLYLGLGARLLRSLLPLLLALPSGPEIPDCELGAVIVLLLNIGKIFEILM